MSRTALITGVTGQDGAYLAKLLLEKGYRVFGTYRRLSTPNFWRLQYLGLFDSIGLVPVDLIDSASIIEALEIAKPDEIYNLAAQSFVGTSFEQPIGSGAVTGMGVTRLLEAVRMVCPEAKLYQASTSELYGDNSYEEQDEQTPFAPSSPYSAAKIYAHHMVRIYRQGYGMFACCGILFNHESPIRGLEFVTRKVTNAAARIKLQLQDHLELGNLEARRDWGYAPEYVEMMWMMLQQDRPDDYVIATNETHSVREFVESAFSCLGLSWKDHVRTSERLLRPVDVSHLRGNIAKAEREIGWRPTVTFDELTRIMVEEDLERWERWKRGETFPWDALHYPDDVRVLSRQWKRDPA